MAATVISAAQRYTSRGFTKIYWCPAIANIAAPTRAELNAGTDLSPQVMDGSGFTVSSDQIDAPDMGSRFTSKIGGAITADDSSLTMYASKTGLDARQLMPQDQLGFIVILYYGDVPGQKMDVWPVTVASVAKQISFQGGDPDTLVFSYSPSAVPSSTVTIPA
jgi:hypothetical protein